jgi:hypothetical protein
MCFQTRTHPCWRDQPMANMTALDATLCFSYFIHLNSQIKLVLALLGIFGNPSIIKATIGYFKEVQKVGSKVYPN